MDARDICAIGDAIAEGLDGTAQRIEEVHLAVAHRGLRAAGPVRALPTAVHDRLAGRLYGGLRAVLPAAIRSGALGLGSAFDGDSRGVQRGPRGKATVSALNGVFGDALARRGNGLAVRMTFRRSGVDVCPTAAGLAAAYPDATGRLVVFLHGFGETDDSWRRYAEVHWGDPGANYGSLLARDLGFTPLYLHYNTGRSISLNGQELSLLMESVLASWPVEAEELVLVGHSAGGRVARAAVAHGARTDAAWATRVGRVITLGVPRSAQRAERAARRTAQALERLPETRPLSDLLESRSIGLKELGAAPEPALPAWVAPSMLPAPGSHVGHFKLLNHPLVYEQLRELLSVRSDPAPARAAREARYGQAARGLRARIRSQRRSSSRSPSRRPSGR